ncbi:MAG: alkaline phosphatase family protein [Clostridiales bacterium]|nr:alkaline phosphatase family protein [Clostridiales bacterium]
MPLPSLPILSPTPANLGCSLLKYYGIEPPNATFPAADTLLDRPWKNVVVVLLDGLGMNILRKHLAPDGFLRAHLVAEYSSVFPPTTVAATTALLSGRTPNETGWLGWSAYFPEVDRNVSYFWNTDNDTGARLDGPNLAEKLLPYRSIIRAIGETGVSARSLASFSMKPRKDFSRFCDQILDATRAPSRTFTYAYWDDPDHTMHLEGTGADAVRDALRGIEASLAHLSDALEDTLLLVTADHGHIDVSTAFLDDDPMLCDMLQRRPSIEARTISFFVKPECMDAFQRHFEARFSDTFRLLTRQQVLESRIFGQGRDHPRLAQLLGDFLAIATGNLQIIYAGRAYRGNHAGFTEAELRIPLIAALYP